eukprot:1143886-Pelagomonas_calceolata.AAC.1
MACLVEHTLVLADSRHHGDDITMTMLSHENSYVTHISDARCVSAELNKCPAKVRDSYLYDC